MYDRLRAVRRKRYPIQLYFGDFEHLTVADKDPRHALLPPAGDHAARPLPEGMKSKPAFDVRSAPTLCDPKAFGPVIRAADWTRIHPDELRFEQVGTRATGSPVSDPRAPRRSTTSSQASSARGCIGHGRRRDAPGGHARRGTSRRTSR